MQGEPSQTLTPISLGAPRFWAWHRVWHIVGPQHMIRASAAGTKALPPESAQPSCSSNLGEKQPFPPSSKTRNWGISAPLSWHPLHLPGTMFCGLSPLDIRDDCPLLPTSHHHLTAPYHRASLRFLPWPPNAWPLLHSGPLHPFNLAARKVSLSCKPKQDLLCQRHDPPLGVLQ